MAFTRKQIIYLADASIKGVGDDLLRATEITALVGTAVLSATVDDKDIEPNIYQLTFPTVATCSVDAGTPVAITADGTTKNTNVITGLSIIFRATLTVNDKTDIWVQNDWHNCLDTATDECAYTFPLTTELQKRKIMNRFERRLIETVLNERSMHFGLSDAGGSLSLQHVAIALRERLKLLDTEWDAWVNASASGLAVADVLRDRTVENEDWEDTDE